MKINKIVIYSSLLILAITSAIILYWLYSPGRVLRVNNGPVPVRPTAQKADQLVFMIVNYCKLIDTTGTMHRYLVSSTVRLPLPLQTDNVPKTCQQIDVPVLIPKGAAPDTYHLHIDVNYQINPLREVIDSFDSQDFTVN